MHGTGYALLTVLGMAAFTLLLRVTVESWPVGLAGSLSRAVTLALLGTWVLSTGDGWRRLRPRGMGAWLLLMGALSIAINLLLFASLKWTTATNNALLFRLDLLFVVLIGGLLGLERVGWRQLALLPVMLVGLAMVVEVQQFTWQGHIRGDVMVVVGAFGFAVNAFIIRRILTRLDESSVALFNHGMSTLGFVALAVLGAEWRQSPPWSASPLAWMWIVLLGIAAAVVLPLYYAALRRMTVWRLRTWLLAMPVVVALAEWPLWGTRPSATQCVGAALIVGGLAVLIRMESAVN